VTDLVHRGLALAVEPVAIGQRLVEHDDAVVRGIACEIEGEGRPAQQARARPGDGEIELALVIEAERPLGLRSAALPGVIPNYVALTVRFVAVRVNVIPCGW
jgi:hypothetical protein